MHGTSSSSVWQTSVQSPGMTCFSSAQAFKKMDKYIERFGKQYTAILQNDSVIFSGFFCYGAVRFAVWHSVFLETIQFIIRQSLEICIKIIKNFIKLQIIQRKLALSWVFLTERGCLAANTR